MSRALSQLKCPFVTNSPHSDDICVATNNSSSILKADIFAFEQNLNTDKSKHSSLLGQIISYKEKF